MSYFVIHSDDDGEVTVKEIKNSKDIKEFREDYSGLKAHKRIPAEEETSYWGERLLIIKGEIVSKLDVKY